MSGVVSVSFRCDQCPVWSVSVSAVTSVRCGQCQSVSGVVSVSQCPVWSVSGGQCQSVSGVVSVSQCPVWSVSVSVRCGQCQSVSGVVSVRGPKAVESGSERCIRCGHLVSASVTVWSRLWSQWVRVVHSVSA